MTTRLLPGDVAQSAERIGSVGLHPAYLAVLNHKQRTREWLLSLALAEGFDGPAARRLSSYLMILMEGAIITALVQNDLDAGRQAREAAAILIDRCKRQG